MLQSTASVFAAHMPRKNIRILDESNSFLWWTDTQDAKTKLQSGAWEEAYRIDPRTHEECFLGIRKIVVLHSSGPSPRSITARESMAAVGACTEGEMIAATKKIKAWPDTASYTEKGARHPEPKAVTICAGKLCQAELYQPPTIDPTRIITFA